MEYTFKIDFITGLPIAEFSYGHEAFAPWLEQEVSKDLVKLQRVIEFVSDVNVQTEILVGKEYTLTIENGEVEVKANVQNIESELPENLVDDVDGFEHDSMAICGIEDLLIMLESWRHFIKK
ncbi:YacL family protein [Thalassotalea psychrophila]|uniref:YacL family protein n=1 Tax=Thalassotalea psychrophila TaxID=3065647 RepID=A0ABY9TW17_9GAMM|nr:YacL family protein [Colwelliaceae bacterium SQ149]